MFDELQALPVDPLLGIITQFRKDTNPKKMDLGVGVYKDAQGVTSVLRAVKQAETWVLENENTKDYVGQLGNLAYGERMAGLVFGEALGQYADRVSHIQTPGGCGALRLLAELIKRSQHATVWVSDPTWINHVPLLGGAGLTLESYPYYNFEHGGIRFEAMCEVLDRAKPGDVVLLHGCCHNPSGADLSHEQWRVIVDLCREKQLVPLIDVAYQGLGDGLDEDAYGLRLAAQSLPEVLVSVSCSKNFALYRERVGSAFVLSKNAMHTHAVTSHLAAVARAMYSMPPSHGALVVETILGSDTLNALWREELADMRHRLQHVRARLAQALEHKLGHARFHFIAEDKGLFSFLGISEAQVKQLAETKSIYMAGSSRMNLAGFNESNMAYFVDALAEIL